MGLKLSGLNTMNLSRRTTKAPYTIIIFLFLWSLAGCSPSGLELSGEVSLESKSAQKKPLPNAPVIMVNYEECFQRLNQRKAGMQMGLHELSNLRIKLSDQLDSLKAKYQAGNYKNQAIKQNYEAITDSIAALKKATKTYKLDYLKSIANWLGSLATQKGVTNTSGEFHFEGIEPGKYLLICVFEHPSQTGFLIKPLDMNQSRQAVLTIQDRDPQLFLQHND